MKNPEAINLNNTQTQKSPQEEFSQISSSLDNFYSLLKTSITKNEILKEYDSLDITIIEFINKHGRNSYYGEKAVELSKKLSQYYNYFKENISLYLDEISEEVPEPTEPSKIDYNLLYEDLRSRLNAFKDNIKNRRYSNEEVENYVILFNEEIKDLVKTSEEDFKLKFVELKNKLVNFYKLFQKQYQQELQQTIYKNEFNDIKLKINEFKSKSDSIKYLIKLENKTEHQILEINNSLLQINQDFNKISSSIENSDIKEKLVLSEELTSIYKDLDNFYFNYINKPEIKLSLQDQIACKRHYNLAGHRRYHAFQSHQNKYSKIAACRNACNYIINEFFNNHQTSCAIALPFIVLPGDILHPALILTLINLELSPMTAPNLPTFILLPFATFF